MNKVIAYDGATRFERVSKARAAQVWQAGAPLVMCPVKLYPFGAWRCGMLAQRDKADEEQRAAYGLNVDTFADRVRNFEWYNATCNETGRYTAFYVSSDVLKEFEPGCKKV